MKINRMEKAHIAQVANIEKSIFSIPWSEDAFEKSNLSDDTIYLVAVEQDKVIGYCGVYISFEVGNITNVAVDANFRKKHVATALIEELIYLCKGKKMTQIVLEVRETNVPAIKLYEKLGFVEMGIRKNFYKKPTENALIMSKEL